jgi:hypothetical protein
MGSIAYDVAVNALRKEGVIAYDDKEGGFKIMTRGGEA